MNISEVKERGDKEEAVDGLPVHYWPGMGSDINASQAIPPKERPFDYEKCIFICLIKLEPKPNWVRVRVQCNSGLEVSSRLASEASAQRCVAESEPEWRAVRKGEHLLLSSRFLTISQRGVSDWEGMRALRALRVQFNGRIKDMPLLSDSKLLDSDLIVISRRMSEIRMSSRNRTKKCRKIDIWKSAIR